MYKGNKIAVVVPAYNEEVLIKDTLSGIPNFIDRIYVVNDGSKDETAERVKDLASIDGRFVLINHEVNMGVGAAIVTGYARSLRDKMDITATMDGDDQMDPRELTRLLDPIINGEADYVKGNRLKSRSTAKGMSEWRYFGNTILTYLTRIAAGNWHINDPQNGYSAIRNEVFKTLKPETIFTWYGYLNDILVKLSVYGFKISDVVIPARYGEEKSKIRYPKYIVRVSRLLLNELIWRLNYQHVRDAPKKAVNVIFAGGTVSAMALLVAGLSFCSAIKDVGLVGSNVELMMIVAVIGLVISVIGHLLKNGGNFGIDEKKI